MADGVEDGLQAPCRVVALEEAFKVVDAAGKAVCYVYFAEGTRLSAVPDRWTRAQAERIAARIAGGFNRAADRSPRPLG